MRRKSAPLSMTIIIILFIISIMGVAKWSLSKGMEIEEQTDLSLAVLQPGAGLNTHEIQVLRNLSKQICNVDHKQGSRNTTTENIYFECLKEHFRDFGTELTAADAENMEQLISDGNKLLLIENGKKIVEMSFDGREVAIHILKKIYGLSGLRLRMNPDGTIEQIESNTGKIYYENNNSRPVEFRFDSLIIILMALTMLLGVCIIITKRNQLFVKDGEYMNEKGIA